MPAKTLRTAKKNKADEFYTQMSDISSELNNYREQFEGKIVFCNCDDPERSNFFKFFVLKFNDWKLKKLIASHLVLPATLDTRPIIDRIEEENMAIGNKYKSYKVEIAEVDVNYDNNIDAVIDLKTLCVNEKNVITALNSNGDFRSVESIEALKEADIVVTNPPFSLFREYVAQLVEYNKKFLIIGNKNAVACKEIFKLCRNNKIQIGYRNMNSDMWFQVPDGYEYEKIVNGIKVKHIMACWFTNLNVNKKNLTITLREKYSPEKYPKYDNYDAIEVSKVKDIPFDYYEPMGVPITFLNKYSARQCEIDGISEPDTMVNLPNTHEYSLKKEQEKDHYKLICKSLANEFRIIGMGNKNDCNGNRAVKINGRSLYCRIIIERIKKS
ncbi:MAG: adenine-specific methyltransferase EcoRI family protein [Christensenellaceae bacterium]|jgi:hypothetical protein|nr:adenine-specific methyltransferase EcoRI family protein [Christensenellaceae bacterium]